jgi:hypothetical protein
VDGVELWARGRAAGGFNCRPGFVEYTDNIDGVAPADSKCYRDLDLNIAHSSASFTMTLGAKLNCANSNAFWGFSDVQVYAVHSPTGCYIWNGTAAQTAGDCWTFSQECQHASAAQEMQVSAGWLSAVDASDGIWQWVTTTGGEASVDAVALGDGHVYVTGRLARGTAVDFGPSQLVQDEAEGEWVKLLSDYSYSGAVSGQATAPLTTGEFTQVRAVYKSGFVSCQSTSTGCTVLDTTQVWQACKGNCEGHANPISFEMLVDGAYILEQSDFGTLDQRCTPPDENDPSGDIVCSVTFAIQPSNMVTLSWYEPSHGIDASNNMGTIVVDLYGKRAVSSTSGTYDTFVAALDQHGSWQWASPAVHSGFYSRGASIATSGQRALAAGRMQGSKFVGNFELRSAGEGDVWVASWDSNGDYQWATAAGGVGEDAAHAIAASNEQVFVCGHFSGNATFGNMTLVSVGSLDVFVAALGLDGTWQWAVAGGGVQSDTIESLVYSHGALFGGVSFEGRARFGSSAVTSLGNPDSAIVRLETTGLWNWAAPYQGLAGDSNKVAGVVVNWDRLFTVGTTTVTSSNMTLRNTTLQVGASLWYSSATMASPVIITRPIKFAAFPSELGRGSAAEVIDEDQATEWDGTFI